MHVFEALMAGKGMAAGALVDLGPCAVLLVDGRGWRVDALHRARLALDAVVAGFVSRGADLRKGHTVDAVARAVRAAVGLSRYPVPDRVAEGGDRRTDSGNVASWRRKAATVGLAEMQSICDREWARTGMPRLALPGEDHPYWIGAPADWPPPRDMQALLAAADAVSARLSLYGRALITPETLTLIARQWAMREADRYLDLTKVVRQTTVPGVKTGVRARSYMQYDIAAAWRPHTLFLDATAWPAPLPRPSHFKGADRYQEAAAAALALVFHRLARTPDLLLPELTSYVATSMLGPTAPAGDRRSLVPTLSRDEMQALHALVTPRAAVLHDVGRTVWEPEEPGGPVTVRSLCEQAERSRNDPGMRSAAIQYYIHLRWELGPVADLPEYLRSALARADQSVEWDAVHYTTRATGQAGLLDQLQKVLVRYPNRFHPGYATHRFRGKAVAANKNNNRHAAIHWAMLGHFDLENLRRSQRVKSEVELLEAGHQHSLCITGIWVKWLEDALAHGDRFPTPAWVYARYAYYWAARTRHQLERLASAHPLPQEKTWWTDDEANIPGISTRRWLVQTTRLYLRAQLGAHTAFLAGLGTLEDFTGRRLDRAGPPIPERHFGSDAIAATYRELLGLTELTERADGPETTQLALWLSFTCGDGGVPAIEVSDENAAAELTGLGYLVPSPEVYRTLPRRDGLPYWELDTLAAARYLRSRRWDAGVIGRIPIPPARGGTRGANRVFNALNRTQSYRPWREIWETLHP
ncbi:hypothetical protein ACFUV1_08430 [Streptomyces griseoincarnatus]